MTTGLQFDRTAAEQLLAVYTTPDIVAQRHLLLEAPGLNLVGACDA